MNVSDFQHKQNLTELERLKAMGFAVKIDRKGYQVWHGNDYISGAGTLNLPSKRYAEADYRDKIVSVLSTIHRSKQYSNQHEGANK